MDVLDKLAGFNLIALEKLQQILCQIPGKKDMIIASELIPPLEYICGASWLKTHIGKIYKFDPTQVTVEMVDQHIIYFIRAHMSTFVKILDQIKSLNNKKVRPPGTEDIVCFHVILLPNVDFKYEEVLEEEGLCDIVKLYRFHWDFLTLDHGVLSLELPEVFEEVYIDKDWSILPNIARSLRIMNMITRNPKFVVTYGTHSEKILQMVNHIESQRPSQTDNNATNDLSMLLIMDRNKDFPSCFLTPVVYGGLLLELYTSNAANLQTSVLNRMQDGKIRWLDDDEESSKAPNKSCQGVTLKMSSAVDTTFRDNKYRHFSEVLTVLSVQAKALGVEGQQFSKGMKLHEMKQFVEKQLPKVAAAKKELEKHLTLSEIIVDELGSHFETIQRIEENMVSNQNRKQTIHEIEENFLTIYANKYIALKLMVLFHLTFDMTADEMTKFCRDYFNAFGYEHLVTVGRLISVGLLPESVLSNTNTTPASKSIASSPLKLTQQQQQKLKSKLLNNLPKIKTTFQSTANKLNQIPEEEPADQGSKPDKRQCPSYVFSKNYIPTVAQLVNCFSTSQSFEELTAKLGTVDDLRIFTGLDPDRADPMPITAMNNLIRGKKFPELLPLKPKTVMVFVVGGITYAEIAACKLIEQTTGTKVIVASNAIISGYDLLNVQ